MPQDWQPFSPQLPSGAPVDGLWRPGLSLSTSYKSQGGLCSHGACLNYWQHVLRNEECAGKSSRIENMLKCSFPLMMLWWECVTMPVFSVRKGLAHVFFMMPQNCQQGMSKYVIAWSSHASRPAGMAHIPTMTAVWMYLRHFRQADMAELDSIHGLPHPFLAHKNLMF